MTLDIVEYQLIIEELKEEYEKVLNKSYVPRNKPYGKLLKGLKNTGIPKDQFRYLHPNTIPEDLIQYELDLRNEIEFFQTGIENITNLCYKTKQLV